MSLEIAHHICPSITIQMLPNGRLRLAEPGRQGVNLSMRVQATDLLAACIGQRLAIIDAKIKRAAALSRYAAAGLEAPGELPLMWVISGGMRLVWYPDEAQMRLMLAGVAVLVFPDWELAALAGGLSAFIDELRQQESTS